MSPESSTDRCLSCWSLHAKPNSEWSMGSAVSSHVRDVSCDNILHYKRNVLYAFVQLSCREKVLTERDVPLPTVNMAEILDKVRDALEMTIVCLLHPKYMLSHTHSSGF